MKTSAGLAQRGFSLAPTATRVVKFEQRQKRAPSVELVALGGNVPRVARLLALAYRIDGMIRAGKIRDWADAARLLGVTRARMTQIANLLLLAPDIQEAILNLPSALRLHDAVNEHQMRSLAIDADWVGQCAAWRVIQSENVREEGADVQRSGACRLRPSWSSRSTGLSGSALDAPEKESAPLMTIVRPMFITV